MDRFTCRTFDAGGCPAVELADLRSGVKAGIAAGFGFNCFSLTRETGGKGEEYIFSDSSFPSAGKEPNLNGIPLLFPFPNRIAGGKFVFEGREVILPRNEGGKNAIHGLVLDKPWEIAGRDTHEAASVTGRIGTDTSPEIASVWPFPFSLEVTYRLGGKTLSMEAVFRNIGKGRLPCGFGSHGYFKIPGAEKVDGLRLQAPFGSRYVLKDLLPTGERIPLEPSEEPFKEGAPIGPRVFDTVYGDLAFREGRTRCLLEGKEKALEIAWEDSAPILILYTPPHRKALAVEPYTCLTDAFNLSARGVESGALFLEPGEESRTSMAITILD